MSGPPPITIDPIIVEPSLLTNPLGITNPTAAVTVDAGPRPDYLKSLEFTNYGTKVTRIGGDFGTATPIGGRWGRVALHNGSKEQFWNHDMTLCGPLIQRPGPLTDDVPFPNSPTKMILDGETYQPLIGNRFSTNNSAMLHSSSEFRWRPGYPSQAVSWFNGTKTLMVWDVVNQMLIWSCNFSSVLPAGTHNFGMMGGTLSNDGRYVALCSRWPKPQNTGRVDFICIVDIELGRLGYVYPGGGRGRGPLNYVPMKIVTPGGGDIDWCSISPLGNYVVVKYGSNSVPSVARCFSVNPTTLACTPRAFSAGDNPLRSVTLPAVDPTYDSQNGWMMNNSNGEVAISADAALTGTSVEVLVGGIRDAATSNHCSNAEKNANGKVVAQSLATGKHMHVSMGTGQLSTATECDDRHTSARCYKTPQVILHTYGYHASNKFADEMVLWPVLLHGDSVPVRCGITSTDYLDSTGMGGKAKTLGEANPCISPGCEKIVFASNWLKLDPSGQANDFKSFVLEPISVAAGEASDYVIGVRSVEDGPIIITSGDDEVPADKLRYFKP